MCVDRDAFRLMIEQLLIECQVVLVVRVGRGVFEITDVLRQNRPAILHPTKGVLQFSAHRQDLPDLFEPRWQLDRFGRVTAGTAQEARLFIHDAYHRIVEAVDDVAVVQQVIIGDAFEAAPGVPVIGHLRFVAAITRGHDHRTLHLTHQQMMQWRIGQHESERGLSGCDTFGKCLPCCIQHHNGGRFIR